MNLKLVSTDEIYDTVSEWWNDRDFPVVDRVLLPETAIVAESDNTLLATVFVYNTDSLVKWIGFPTTNPHSDKRKGVLKYMLSNLNQVLPSNTFIFTTSGTDKVMRALIDSEFTEADKEISHFLKII